MTTPQYREIKQWSARDFVRFWSRVKVTGSNDCWLWDHPEPNGYGQFRIGRRGEDELYPAHRVSYSMSHAAYKFDLHVLHKCDVRACVNPNHLFLGTDMDNSKDCISKGRHAHGPRFSAAIKGRMAKGEKHWNVVLDTDRVLLIRRLASEGDTWASLARHFGVSPSCIQAIVERRTWAHIA